MLDPKKSEANRGFQYQQVFFMYHAIFFAEVVSEVWERYVVNIIIGHRHVDECALIFTKVICSNSCVLGYKISERTEVSRQ